MGACAWTLGSICRGSSIFALTVLFFRGFFAGVVVAPCGVAVTGGPRLSGVINTELVLLVLGAGEPF